MAGPLMNPATPVTAAFPQTTPGVTGQNFGFQGPQQPSPPQSIVRYVENMAEVLEYPAGPKEHNYFPEKNTNVIWVRDTDDKGQIKNPLRKLTYNMEEVPFGPEANFVTKQEFQQLYEMTQSNNTMLGKLLEELGGSSK